MKRLNAIKTKTIKPSFIEACVSKIAAICVIPLFGGNVLFLFFNFFYFALRIWRDSPLKALMCREKSGNKWKITANRLRTSKWFSNVFKCFGVPNDSNECDMEIGLWPRKYGSIHIHIHIKCYDYDYVYESISMMRRCAGHVSAVLLLTQNHPNKNLRTHSILKY